MGHEEFQAFAAQAAAGYLSDSQLLSALSSGAYRFDYFTRGMPTEFMKYFQTNEKGEPINMWSSSFSKFFKQFKKYGESFIKNE